MKGVVRQGASRGRYAGLPPQTHSPGTPGPAMLSASGWIAGS